MKGLELKANLMLSSNQNIAFYNKFSIRHVMV